MTTSAGWRGRRLRSGHRVLVRRQHPTDATGLVEMFEQLSERSRYRRFSTVKSRLSKQTLAYLTDIDHHDHEALVAVVPATGELVGVARFIRDHNQPRTAEMAITVLDSWQGQGLGSALMEQLSQRAAEVGIAYLTAQILAENRPMIELIRRGRQAHIGPVRQGAVQATIGVPERP